MAIDFKHLEDEVAKIQSTHEATIKFITSLKAELKDVSDKLANSNVDTSELDTLINKLDVSTDALASAISGGPSNPDGN